VVQVQVRVQVQVQVQVHVQKRMQVQVQKRMRMQVQVQTAQQSARAHHLTTKNLPGQKSMLVLVLLLFHSKCLPRLKTMTTMGAAAAAETTRRARILSSSSSSTMPSLQHVWTLARRFAPDLRRTSSAPRL
jgi:hypothetical protein